MLGIIVAPKAHVYQEAGNLNGQFIAKIAGNNGELHQVTLVDDSTPTPTPGEEEKPTPTPNPGEEEKPTPTPTPGEEEKPTPTPINGEEEKPSPIPTEPSSSPEDEIIEKDDTVKTGDITNTAPLISTFLASIAGILGIVIFKRKK